MSYKSYNLGVLSYNYFLKKENVFLSVKLVNNVNEYKKYSVYDVL